MQVIKENAVPLSGREDLGVEPVYFRSDEVVAVDERSIGGNVHLDDRRPGRLEDDVTFGVP
jgi:hypothetical protein